jgi:hypothetical protein
MLQNNSGKISLVLFLLLTATCFGQTIPSPYWDVPYFDQLNYYHWGQSACGPTSTTMILKYLFPNMPIDVPEVYHAGAQTYTYNGPLTGYRNVGFASNTGDYWTGTTPDDRLIRVPTDFQKYYIGTYSGFNWDAVGIYLTNTWGVTIPGATSAQHYATGTIDDVLTALKNGPVITSVDEGPGGHVVLMTGFMLDALSTDPFIIINEPYYPYVTNSATRTSNYPTGYKARYVRKSTFSGWYSNGKKFYIGLTIPTSYTSTVRQNTVLVDNGSMLIDETLASAPASTGQVGNFTVDQIDAKDAQGNYAWRLYHNSGIDYTYATQTGHSARWTPSALTTGWYLVKIRSYKRTDSSSAYYSLKQYKGVELGGITVDQKAVNNTDQNTPLEVTMGIYYLSTGAYVEVPNAPVNTAMDTVVFEYVDQNCVITVKSAINNASAMFLAANRYEAEDAAYRLESDNALAAATSCPVIPPSAPSVTDTFQNQNAWTYSVTDGSPTSNYKNGDWQITSPAAASPGAYGMITSKFNITDSADVTFNVQHANYGSTTVGGWLNGNWIWRLTIDTDDTAYMFYCPSVSYCDGYLKYPSGAFMNRKLVVRVKTTPTQIQFYINGTLMQTYAYTPATGSYQLAFGVGSISWKSGFNVSDIYSVSATASTITGTLPTTTVQPTTGNIAVTVSGGTVNQFVCQLNNKNVTVPMATTAYTAGSYTLSGCVWPTGFTGSISPSTAQTLNVGQSVTFAVTLTATTTSTSFNETFADGTINAYTTVLSGSPVITPTVGDLTVRAGQSGNAATFYSKAQFKGNMSATATFIKEPYGRSWFGLYSIAKQSYPIMGLLDSNDWPYLDVYINNANPYRTGVSPYLNRLLKLGFNISGSTAQFLVDGTVVGSATFDPTVCPCQLAFAVGSVSWKSGDNLTHFKSITATADFINGQLPAAAPTTGNISVAVSGGNGSSFTCQLNGQNVTVPMSSKAYTPGNFTLSNCSPPTGFTASISPSTAQTLSAGSNLGFTVNLAAAVTTGTVQVNVTMNGQPFSGAMACGFLNSPNNIQVNTVPFSQSNLPLGAYYLGCAAGPPNSQLQSINPNASQTLTAGGVVTYTVAYVWVTVTVYSNPLQIPMDGSYWTWTLSASSWNSNGTWTIQPILTFNGVAYNWNHPAQFIEALKQLKNAGSSGNIDTLISYFQGALSAWPPYTVAPSGYSPPTLSSYWWNPNNATPQNRVNFSGNFTGTGFVNVQQVQFCQTGTTTCWTHPSVGVAVNSSISMSVYNVNLTTGSWQAKVVTAYGSVLGPSFNVQ